MKIHHIAIWTTDVDRLCSFYETYFEASVGKKYINPEKKFESRFLTFAGDTKIEVMARAGILPHQPDEHLGLAHMAISVGSREKVEQLTHQLELDGFQIRSQPRETGDGFYESVIEDVDGNQVEITV